MRWGVLALAIGLCGSNTSTAQEQLGVLPDAPKPQLAVVVGTVTDVRNDVIPGATVVLEGPSSKYARTVVADDNGFFQLKDLEPGILYHITISANGFANWTSPAILLQPGQYAILAGSKLAIAAATTTIDVASAPATPEEIGAEQEKIEEKQRIFGIFPNFYVVYDQAPAPLTAKLKFKLAAKVSYDPVTFAGVAFIAAINQAGDVPNYGQGAQGYAKRFGASYTDGFADIMIGGAILPSLLHQDPRYYYQGTGTGKSRALHALAMTVITHGDDGRREPNFSTIGGDLAAAAISNAYYPASDRSAARVFSTALVNTGERGLANLAQEFLLRKITSSR